MASCGPVSKQRRMLGNQRPNSLILDFMVMNGRRPGAENADHGKNGKTERLLAEHRTGERGDWLRWLRFAAKARQQAETVERGKRAANFGCHVGLNLQSQPLYRNRTAR